MVAIVLDLQVFLCFAFLLWNGNGVWFYTWTTGSVIHNCLKLQEDSNVEISLQSG